VIQPGRSQLFRSPRSPFLQHRRNRLNAADNLIGIPKHLVVPEPDHSKPYALQLSCPDRIHLLPFHVLPPVDFHDEAHIQATKIDNVLTNRLLTSKA
jgi:hypothetical protein